MGTCPFARGKGEGGFWASSKKTSEKFPIYAKLSLCNFRLRIQRYDFKLGSDFKSRVGSRSKSDINTWKPSHECQSFFPKQPALFQSPRQHSCLEYSISFLYALTVNYFQIQQKYERRCLGKFRHVSYKRYRFAGAFEIEVYLSTVSQQLTVFW